MMTRTPVKQTSCIIDIDLALSDLGLMFSLRMSEVVDVWLVRALWRILDDHGYMSQIDSRYLHRLSEDWSPQSDESIGKVLNQWQAVRLESDLLGCSMYWAGDSTAESAFPAHVEKKLVDRYEMLALELEERIDDTPPDKRQFYYDGARDAAALCAALSRYRPLVLTVCGHRQDQKPRLCEYLQSCGIPTEKLDGDRSTPSRDIMLQLMRQAGVLELLWGGLNLAVIHVVAPGSLSVAPVNDSGLLDGYSEVLPIPRMRPWENAYCFWYLIG